MLEFTLDVSSLALEFTLGCAYLFFCRGSGAFARIRSFTMINCDFLAEFTTLKGTQSKPICMVFDILLDIILIYHYNIWLINIFHILRIEYAA
jgi:hypothetical protein